MHRDLSLAQVKLTAAARSISEYIAAHGASFFDELVHGTGLLQTQVEEALGELVATGLASADSFGGLRALLVPSNKRRPLAGARRRRRAAVFGIEDAGRWALTPASPSSSRNNQANCPSPGRRGPEGRGRGSPFEPEAIEHIAHTLLRRYGVVCKRVLERETVLPPWRELLRVFRRMEARGEIRGGRFVAGFSGEQYALPEAVGTLREVRRRSESGRFISLSAGDPLNLIGIITPGQRLPALASNRILYRNGVPVAVQAAGKVRFVQKLGSMEAWEAKNALLRRNIPPPLRIYLE